MHGFYLFFCLIFASFGIEATHIFGGSYLSLSISVFEDTL